MWIEKGDQQKLVVNHLKCELLRVSNVHRSTSFAEADLFLYWWHEWFWNVRTKVFDATSALLGGSNKQHSIWEQEKFFLPTSLLSVSSLLCLSSMLPQQTRSTGTIFRMARGSSAFMIPPKIRMFSEEKEKVPGLPPAELYSCLHLPFKNIMWLICIVFKARIVIFYYSMRTRALFLYTKNIIRKEIIWATNPSWYKNQ